jgi:hypothetical protein
MPRKIHQAPLLHPLQTIARTVAERASDPRHRFHAPSSRSDLRQMVAAGARVQRMRGRSQVG